MLSDLEKIEYTKMCASLLGYKNINNDDSFIEYKTPNGDFYSFNDLLFDSDWNLIMDIIDTICKISKIKHHYNQTGLINFCINRNPLNYGSFSVELSFDANRDEQKTVFVENENKKEAVIEAIYKFLIWYNNLQNTCKC